MKFTLATLIAATAVSAAEVQTAHFRLKDASNIAIMDLAVKADSSAFVTNEDHPIASIQANDFPIQSHCDLDTDGEAEFKLTRDGDNQILELHPPVGIKSITCKGHCIPNGSPAYPDGVMDPSVPCCNGLVLDTWCKAYSSVGH